MCLIRQELKIFWEGKIPIQNVKWKFAPEREIFLSDSLEVQREDIWNAELSTYPETYDGDVLVLEDFSQGKEQMVFHSWP